MNPLEELHGAAPPIEILEQYFESHNWSFERDGDEEIVAAVKGSWSDYELRALWREEERVLQFIAQTGISVPRDRTDPAMRATLFELLGLINEQLWIGHFEWWSADGAVLFRHAVLLDSEESLAMEQARGLVEAAIDSCERYYPVLQFAIWGGKSPEEALRAALVETFGEA